MTAYGRVVIRLHRAELAIAMPLALGLTGWIVLVLARTDATSVPAGCFERWLASGIDGAGDCAAPILAWGSALNSEGTYISALMAYVPFVIGIVAGVPIVAAELEARTAATAWSLSPSRVAWLARTLMPVVVLVGGSVFALVAATSLLESDREIWGYSRIEEFGRFGAPVAARVVGAMAIALLVGALLGRILPAVALAGAVVIASAFGVNAAHQAWQTALPEAVITTMSPDGDLALIPGAVATDTGFVAPNGDQLSIQEARRIAHTAGAPQPEPGDEQDLPAARWLETNGYREVSLGITPASALGWEPYELAAWVLVSAIASGGAIIVVDRKRPT